MRMYVNLLTLGLLVCCLGCGNREQQADDANQAVSLKQDLMPLFVRSCGGCHKREGGSEAAVKNKVYYETTDDIMGLVGKYIIAGNPDESGTVKVLDQTYPVGEKKVVMPPPTSQVPKWSAKEIELFKTWISEGAADN